MRATYCGPLCTHSINAVYLTRVASDAANNMEDQCSTSITCLSVAQGTSESWLGVLTSHWKIPLAMAPVYCMCNKWCKRCLLCGFLLGSVCSKLVSLLRALLREEDLHVLGTLTVKRGSYCISSCTSHSTVVNNKLFCAMVSIYDNNICCWCCLCTWP